MPDQPMYRSAVLDPLGLGAGLCDARGLGDGSAQATHPTPARRDRTAGAAVNAMGLPGRGLVHPALSRVPRGFQQKPTARRLAPRVAPAPLHADARGRPLTPLYAAGVTALSRRTAATAAQRLGLASPLGPLDRPRLPGAGRSHSAQTPEAAGGPSPRGARRAQQPALQQGLLEVIVAHPAGLPVLLTPRRGQSREAPACGQVVPEPPAPGQTTDGPTARVAARARETAATLQQRAATQRQSMTRVPATGNAAPAALAPAPPQTLAPRPPGSRSPGVTATDGGVAPRGVLLAAAPRPALAPRTVDHHLRTQGQRAGAACQHRGRLLGACAAEAQQA